MPRFKLQTLTAVQSLHDPARPLPSHHRDWFEAPDAMRAMVQGIEFDVAIIGAGAYGLPLGSRIKEAGKVAIHLGGSTQLLFGIWGAVGKVFLTFGLFAIAIG